MFSFSLSGSLHNKFPIHLPKCNWAGTVFEYVSTDKVSSKENEVGMAKIKQKNA